MVVDAVWCDTDGVPVARRLTDADIEAMRNRRQVMQRDAHDLRKNGLLDAETVDEKMREMCEQGDADDVIRRFIMACRRRDRVGMYMQLLAASVEETMQCAPARCPIVQ